jgi:hypothetical protein
MYTLTVAMLLRQDDNLPRIPGGVATVAVIVMLFGLWMIFAQGSSDPNAAPLKLIGALIVVGALVVLAEVMGYANFAATPW